MSVATSGSTAKFRFAQSGQSLVETALIVPLVLLITFNAVNFAYFFFVGIHLVSASRQGAEYSIQGFSTPRQLALPSAGPSDTTSSVSWLALQDMTGLNSSSTNSWGQVCTEALGTASAGKANCSSFGNIPAGFSFPDTQADPESTFFVLNRVDVYYKVSPLIPVGLFGLTLTPSPTFHYQASMRAMN
jgi:Flp pilus assembly protein TadG